ncbi:MAG: protein kinase domain-containing protein [Kofleriaceae bacterium]
MEKSADTSLLQKPADTSLLQKPADTSLLPRPALRVRHQTHPPLDFSNLLAIDRFGLIREIARGGMGQVFLARDTKLGRKVAIKLLLRDDPTLVARFVAEARATARCTHENIVTIHEVGEHAGLPFMVLEYLEGTTLAALIEATVSPRALTELMVPVARALERAHEFGIVHRDLKPSNIIVTDRGVVKVLDFGVAKWFESDDVGASRLSAQSGQPSATEDSLVGTVPYMSPEQWGAAEVSHASDVWAVGIMFWRALTGVHPAGGSKPMTADALRARLIDLETPLPSIATRAPTLSPELVTIVDRCLAMRATDRYSAGELLADLQAFLQPRSILDHESPFRGLAAFNEADAKYFFGRSTEIRSALARLEQAPLLAVIGPSGVGKSSFVHAGLVPAIRASSDGWSVRVVRPGRTPLSNLANALADDPGRVTEVIGQLVTSPGLFGEALREEAARTQGKILLVVDQLEELFTLSSDPIQREAFLRAILAAADDSSAPVRIITSMRADFLDRLAVSREFLDEISRALFFLAAPDRDALRETVVRPAELAGYAFEDGIVDDMMTVATTRGALPLLQFAATALWDRRDRKRKLLTQAAYDAMGRVGGAFVRHADQIAAEVSRDEQPMLRTLMTRLVTPEGTRAVVDRAELAELGDVDRVLDLLVRGRLVVVHTEPTGHSTVEIVHEVLITEWPMIVRWLDDNQATRGFTSELRGAVRQWVSRGRPADLVWRGATAQDALALVRRHQLDLGRSEQEFLAAMEHQLGRTKRIRIFALAAAFALLGLVFAGGAIAYVRIANAEREAQANASALGEEAERARRAEAEAERRLAAIEDAKRESAAADVARKSAQSAADAARADAEKAKAAVAMSREELQSAYERAVTAARSADVARKVAERKSEEAATANARLDTLLAKERKHAEQLQQELNKIVKERLR